MANKNLENLRNLRARFNLEDETDRKQFLCELHPRLILTRWKGPFPNLRNIFEKKEIDSLLLQSIESDSSSMSLRLIQFFIFTCYEDEPDLNNHGDPILRRTTAVHQAYHREKSRVIHPLFKIYNKFNANYFDESGITHFEIACITKCYDAVKGFLHFGQSPNCLVPGKTYSVLHSALIDKHAIMAELLLRYSANLNLTNADRLTILHVICSVNCDAGIAKILFDISDQRRQRVFINAQDKSGNTPLHLALKYVKIYTKRLIELLIGRGADINLANAEGLTPLQIVCTNNYDKELVEVFLKKNNHIQQAETLDDSVHELLRLAMVNFQHHVVDIILDHEVDLSNFVFPTLSCFSKRFDELYRIGDDERYREYESKLELVSGILSIIERLERRGYELDQSDALTILKLFVKYKSFQKLEDIDDCWRSETEFASRMKEHTIFPLIQNTGEYERELNETMMTPRLSTYDLVQLQPQEVTQIFAYQDLYKIAKSSTLSIFPKHPILLKKACALHMTEKISRGLCRRWALDALFQLLLQFRMPTECCYIIMEQLTNEDLCNIFIAATA